MARAPKLPDDRRAALRIIREACSPDLIHIDLLAFRPPKAHRTWGCCYVACEVLFELWAKERGYKPYYVEMNRCNCQPDCPGGTHWFLKNSDGTVLDPTVAQFKGVKPPYSKGICCGFQQLSNRAKRMMTIISERLR